ncbi:MAG TPA: tetratricopeptide repeat protein [Pyrinomonadaceae bacterium]
MRHPLTLRRSGFGLALLLFVLIAPLTVEAKDNWLRVQTKNFTLVGNASEKDMRQVANRLEQFRMVFGLLLPKAKLNSPVPTTVIVFKSDGAYKPFKVNPNFRGYFQPGDDVNYITLTSEKSADDAHPFRTIFHEYVHLLVKNTMGEGVPLWFNEGLAEYYSTFDVQDGDRKVLLGDLVSNHVLYLRDNKLLPLRTLLAVDHKSPYYNEGNKMNIFYSESWMLMHYLLQGEGQKRRPALGRFIDLLESKVPIADAFQQAFESNIEAFEKSFKSYIQGAKYMATGVTFKNKLDFESEMQSSPLSEAEAQAYLGDLLAHTRRFNDAETYLQKALSLNPDLPMAHASLGMLRVRQHRLAEAKPYLEKAIAKDSQNYLAHYYYALALSGLSTTEYRTMSSYAPETAAAMRTELKKAIALKPDFPESYALLGFVNVVRNEEIDETIELLKRALSTSRANQRILFMLSQLYMRKERFADARQLLEPIAQNSPNPEMRQQAEALLANIKRTEEEIARFKEFQKEETARQELINQPATDSAVTVEQTVSEDDQNSALADALRQPEAGETRLQGVLTSVECSAKGGVVFHVRAGDRVLKIHSDSFEQVDITTFITDVGGNLSCGPRKPENPIIITFAAAKAGSKFDGEARALEFVPATFVLKK